MREDEPGWCYVGNGKLRFKDATGWTDKYRFIDVPPMNSESSGPTDATSSRDLRSHRRRPSPPMVAVCAGLIVFGVAGGLLRPDVPAGWISWATAQTSEISALISPTAPPTAGVGAGTKVKVKATPPRTPAKRPSPTGRAKPTSAPVPVVAKPTVKPEPSPTWDGRGFSRANYANRVGQIPLLVGYAREDSAAGLESATYTDLAGLGRGFDSIGLMPAPPGVDQGWWAGMTTTLSKSSQRSAGQWLKGDRALAMARFDVVVTDSNTLIAKVNTAFGLQIPQSRTVT